MKPTKLLLFPLLMAAMATMPQGAMSQVTIGADRPPQNFSVLELISNGGNALRLPQLDNVAVLNLKTQIEASSQEKKDLARGLTIYNSTRNCVQYWNGSDWIPAGICDPVIPAVVIPVTCTQSIPPVTFMAYNLGADPTFDTPKKQMQYLATHVYNALDSTVYGAWYQWGRQTDGHQKRNSIESSVNASALSDGDYNGNGQIINSTYKSQFIKAEDGITYQNWQKNHVDASDLWGNGKLIGTETTGSGVICDDCSPAEANGKYFQSTTWAKPDNNPCPSGFRVPTQDEWERIGAYDCQPNLAGGNISGITAAGASNEKGLTWVPVVCGIGSNITAVKCQAQSTSWNYSTPGSETRSGYAIYTNTDWTANSSYTTDLTNPAAKEPLLFLPAAGYRVYTSARMSVGYIGNYWSSTVNGITSHNLGFISTDVRPSNNNARATALSLRCVAE